MHPPHCASNNAVEKLWIAVFLPSEAHEVFISHKANHWKSSSLESLFFVLKSPCCLAASLGGERESWGRERWEERVWKREMWRGRETGRHRVMGKMWRQRQEWRETEREWRERNEESEREIMTKRGRERRREVEEERDEERGGTKKREKGRRREIVAAVVYVQSDEVASFHMQWCVKVSRYGRTISRTPAIWFLKVASRKLACCIHRTPTGRKNILCVDLLESGACMTVKSSVWKVLTSGALKKFGGPVRSSQAARRF